MRLETSAEVQAALDQGQPVVALESTIIAHGFPRPDNLAVGLALEAAVRAGGAVPATIALLAGRAPLKPSFKPRQVYRLIQIGFPVSLMGILSVSQRSISSLRDL